MKLLQVIIIIAMDCWMWSFCVHLLRWSNKIPIRCVQSFPRHLTYLLQNQPFRYYYKIMGFEPTKLRQCTYALQPMYCFNNTLIESYLSSLILSLLVFVLIYKQDELTNIRNLNIHVISNWNAQAVFHPDTILHSIHILCLFEPVSPQATQLSFHL